MTIPNIYISVEERQSQKHLTIDGPLDLLGKLLATIRNSGNAQQLSSLTGTIDAQDQDGGEDEREPWSVPFTST